MSQSVSVRLHVRDELKPLSVAQLMLLPYRSAEHIKKYYGDPDLTGSLSANHQPETDSVLPAAAAAASSPPQESTANISATNTQSSPRQPTVVLAISMPHEMGIRSWRWYEATIETLAVGVYLYATFVLTSTQFLSGNTGLAFATIMALCSSVVRILENIFWSPR